MHHVSLSRFRVAEDKETEAASQPPPPAAAAANVVGNSAAPPKPSRPITAPVAWGVALLTAITIVTAILVSHFRDHALAATERELGNVALILAEQTDRAFQAVELAQSGL